MFANFTISEKNYLVETDVLLLLLLRKINVLNNFFPERPSDSVMLSLGQDCKQLVRIPCKWGILVVIYCLVIKPKWCEISEGHKKFKMSPCSPHPDSLERLNQEVGMCFPEVLPPTAPSNWCYHVNPSHIIKWVQTKKLFNW